MERRADSSDDGRSAAMSDGARGGREPSGRTPHSATVMPSKKPVGPSGARRPHAATVVQPRIPHAATTVQPKLPFGGTPARTRGPHAATVPPAPRSINPRNPSTDRSDSTSQRKARGESTSPCGTIQRHISWNAILAQFELDPNRPGWIGTVAALVPGGGQSRNHIIDFENIQNDVAFLLNVIVGANTLFNRTRLIALTDAVMPTPGLRRTDMVNHRNTLLASITALTFANYDGDARALLSRLNSSLDNVRVGDAAINASIGQNIDADFVAGTTPFAGGTVRTTANPAGIVVGAQLVLTLTAVSNARLYAYQEATTQGLSFVIHPITNRQLSSVTGPTVGTALGNPAYPVLVTDPLAVGVPFLFG